MHIGAVPAAEPGAGCGLCGLHFAARGGCVRLSDYNPVVLDLLQRNVEENDDTLAGARALPAAPPSPARESHDAALPGSSRAPARGACVRRQSQRGCL